MEYNKLNNFYLALTDKPAGVWENEPALKRKSTQTGIQAMEYTFR